MSLVKPAALQPGDTIGVIAPGDYSPHRSEMQLGIDVLERCGYQVVFGQHVNDRYGYLAGDDHARADDFNRMWANPSVKAVMCWGAVWGAARLIPHIDFDQIRATPKLFIGCGNATALHLAIAREASLLTLHAPDFSRFYASRYTLDAFVRAIGSTEPLGAIGTPERSAAGVVVNPPLIPYVSGHATGRIVGGSLPAVAASLGTPYEIETEGRILLLEARDLRTYTVERYLTALWLAGKLQAAAGIVVTECVNCAAGRDESNTFSLEEVLENRLPLLSVPSLYGLRLGQGTDTMPVPLGAEATLDTEARTLVIREAALQA